MSYRLVGLFAVMVFCFVVVPGWAATKDWNDGTDNWSNAVAWTPAGVPDAGDIVNIVFADDVARTVTYDYTGAAITLGPLEVDMTGIGTNAITLAMSANALTTNGGEQIGQNGRGVFNQSAGTHTVNTNDLRLGGNATGSGTYNLSGTGALVATSSELIGYFGNGNFIQTSGSNTISGVGHDLFLGVGIGTGNYTLSGGSLLAGEYEFVGWLGTGAFDQSGGTNAIASTLIVASEMGATGTYSLSGSGQLSANQIAVGDLGTGTFNQSGGINTAGTLNVGVNALGLGAYTLTAGMLTVDGTEAVGNFATGNGAQSGGTFTQTGSTMHKVGTLSIGANSASTGSMSLSTGTLVSTVGEFIGNNGSGSLTQTSGVHTSTGDISIGAMPGSSGTYILNGGTANAVNIFIGGRAAGAGGTGVLTVGGSSTSLNVTGTITVYNTPGTAFNLQAGTLNAAAINVNGIPSLFNWTSGTLNIMNDVIWDAGAAATSTGSIFGSSLSLSSSKILRVAGNETIGGNGNFSLSVSSGMHNVSGTITVKPGGSLSGTGTSTTALLTYGSLTQAGGTVSNFRNNGAYNYQSGLINGGPFINDGTIMFGPSMTVSTSFQNDTTMTVGASQMFTATGGITNLGTFTLAGGTIGSSSTFTNTVGGTLTAHGTISPSLTNSGTMICDGVLSLNSLTNNGILQGAGTLSYGSNTIQNNAGGVINATTPGGALVLGFSLTNSAGATVNIGPTSTFSVAQSWTNSGVVNLQGSGARLSGGTITNSGLIQGFGMITSPFSSSWTGILRANGGELDYTASGLANNSGGQIQIFAGSTFAVLQGMTSNASTITLTGGTFDNNNHTLTNNGTINGYGTIRTSGLTNSSTRLLAVGEGNMDVIGNFTNNGVVNIQTGRTAYFYNAVNGSGSFTGGGTAVFLNSLSPGNSPALVNFGGGVTLGGGTSLIMELGGATPGTGYDQIHVGGQLSIGGALAVSLINGFAPAPWTSFDLMDWGTLSGTFSSLSLPTLAVGQWDTSQLYVNGTLSVVLAGDFNHNGVVDAADYAMWRSGLGTTFTASDYNAWRAHFGEGSAGGSSLGAAAGAEVPEPHAMGLLLVAGVMLAWRAAGDMKERSI